MKRALRVAGLAMGLLVLMTTINPMPASATLAAGTSQTCDSQRQCVWGGSYSANAAGRLEAGCRGASPWAVAISIACTVNGVTNVVDGEGSSGSVEVHSTGGPAEVCWRVWARLYLNAEEITTSGCSVEII